MSNKFTSHPPKKMDMEQFILGAEKPIKNHGSEFIYPWNHSKIRNDVQKTFTVKLPEQVLLKIKFISDQTNKSQQKIIREIICEEIDMIVAKLISSKRI